VDVATHLLFSLALARGIFPRRPWSFVLAVVAAGVLADLDLLARLLGPSATLSGRLTYTHSLPGTIAVIAVAVLLAQVVGRKSRPAPHLPATRWGAILFATSLAAIAHLFLDAATSRGTALLWPFRQTRFAWDLLPSPDPWILLLLVAGIFLPELFALVSSEIGAKEKAPRGRNGALIALALICVYAAVRATLHANAAAQLDTHSYRGESPHRAAALPDSLSIFTWHGIVETSAQICTVDVPTVGASHFDSETAACTHKPDPSPALAAAQQTDAARQFLAVARFPRASVASADSETEVVVRDMKDVAEGETRTALAARVLLDTKGGVASQQIAWVGDIHLR
jgi:inner membrane protein